MLVGIILDTHGLMRPEAVTALHGSDLIIHAGDVGKPEVIDELRVIAPVFVIRGMLTRSPGPQSCRKRRLSRWDNCHSSSFTT